MNTAHTESHLCAVHFQFAHSIAWHPSGTIVVVADSRAEIQVSKLGMNFMMHQLFVRHCSFCVFGGVGVG